MYGIVRVITKEMSFDEIFQQYIVAVLDMAKGTETYAAK